MVDKVEEGAFVGFHAANKSRTITIRFPEKALQKLRRQAFRLGIGPTTLVRMWTLEKLQV